MKPLPPELPPLPVTVPPLVYLGTGGAFITPTERFNAYIYNSFTKAWFALNDAYGFERLVHYAAPADSEVVRLNAEPMTQASDDSLVQKCATLEQTNSELQREVAELNRKLSELEAERERLYIRAERATSYAADLDLRLNRDLAASQALCAELRDAIRAVLCDADGTPCFHGSDADRKVIADALAKTPETVGKEVADAALRIVAHHLCSNGHGWVVNGQPCYLCQHEQTGKIVVERDKYLKALVATKAERDKLRAEVERLRATVDHQVGSLRAAQVSALKAHAERRNVRARAEAAEARIEHWERVAEGIDNRLHEEEAKVKTLTLTIKDDCETERLAREHALKVMTEKQVNGDSYGVPTIADVVQTLVDRVTSAEARNARLVTVGNRLYGRIEGQSSEKVAWNAALAENAPAQPEAQEDAR